jgi:ubiquinone/menaquinone biosynthesis C-methylase UbiE
MVSHNMTSLVSPVEERELERQRHLTRLLLEEMGGCLPREQMRAKHLMTVLDVACGAGGWALEMAQTTPALHVTGLDLSEPHMRYAQRRATEDRLVNVRFLTQDMRTLATGPFEPASFDLINVAFIAPTLLTMDYAALMHSLFRLCRPGGVIRWTEMEFPLTTSLAFEQLMALVCRALDMAGQTFIPLDMQRSAAIFDDWRRALGLRVTPFARRHLGITPMMGGWLRHAGCRAVEAFPTSVEVSIGTRTHVAFVQQVEVFGQQMVPFLCEQGIIAADDLADLLKRVQEDMQQEHFCGLCLLLTVYGYKAA